MWVISYYYIKPEAKEQIDYSSLSSSLSYQRLNSFKTKVFCH